MVLFLSETGFAQNKTPDHWKCENKVGGSWTFGVAPAGCDASTFGEDQYIWNTYIPVVFDQQKNTNPERNRYMEELGAVMRESADRYIHKRNPNVSASETEAFVHAALAMAHQESYWTHYRQSTDLRLKMMRGDSGHGHGLMQIDDRWHFVEVDQKGVGWNLIDNLIYAYEQYFHFWQKALTANCVPSASDFRARARSAYSAYNGGAGKICRWTDPSDKWARNDKGFVEKYDQKTWENYIQNPNLTSQVNVECLLDGNENCPIRSLQQKPETPVEKKIYQNSQNELCVFKESVFQCVTQMRDLACLQNWAGGTVPEIYQLPVEYEKTAPKEVIDRHELCYKNSKAGIFSFGQNIQILKTITFRATPAGQPLGAIAEGTVMQIYDFEVRDPSQLKRYYQVFWEGKWGFIYAGDVQDHLSWARASSRQSNHSLIARPGQKIKINRAGGINFRHGIGGQKLSTIPEKTIIEVRNLYGRSDDNQLYYEVKYQNQTGIIFSGRSLPEKTFSQWTGVVSE